MSELLLFHVQLQRVDLKASDMSNAEVTFYSLLEAEQKMKWPSLLVVIWAFPHVDLCIPKDYGYSEQEANLQEYCFRVRVQATSSNDFLANFIWFYDCWDAASRELSAGQHSTSEAGTILHACICICICMSLYLCSYLCLYFLVCMEMLLVNCWQLRISMFPFARLTAAVPV